MPGRALMLLFGVAVLTAGAAADVRAQTDGGVVIVSAPPGAVVELVGDYVFRGVTPWRLERGLSGEYEIRARKAGYEEWEGYVVLSAGRTDSVFIRLVRKTPFGAGLRSAIFPGWGQFYTGQRGKASAFFLAEAAAVAGVIWTDAKRTNAQNDVDDAWRTYHEATQVEEIEAAYSEVLRRYDELHKWHEYRKRWAYAAAAVWLANVLDATLLFPAPGEGVYSEVPAAEGSGLYAAIEPGRSTLGLVVRF